VWASAALRRLLGPEIALAYILQQEAVDIDEWCRWAEGGVVMDTVRHHVLLFGDDVAYDLPLRNICLSLMREIWQGWAVEWAFAGSADMAAYLWNRVESVPLSEMLQLKIKPPFSVDPLPPDKTLRSVGSVRFQDNSLGVYQSLWNLEYALGCGPELLELLRAIPRKSEIDLGDRNFPWGGFHLDEQQKTLLCWNTEELGHWDEIRTWWPGWQIESIHDNFERHFALAEGRLHTPRLATDYLLRELESELVSPDHSDWGANVVREQLTEVLNDGGKIGWINPYSLTNNPLKLDVATKKVIFDRAVASWMQKRREENK
jgi:hypothetical protein